MRTNLKNWLLWLLVFALVSLPIQSYALGDNFIQEILADLVRIFGWLALVAFAAGAGLHTLLLSLRALGLKSATYAKPGSPAAWAVATVVAVALVILLAPAEPRGSSPTSVTPQKEYPFGLVMEPDPADNALEGAPVNAGVPFPADTGQSEKVYTYVETPPHLAGGNAAAIQFVKQTLQYPAPAREHFIEGLVYVSFVVGTDGEVRNARIVKGLDYSCDEEALRVVKELPTFFAGVLMREY